MFYELPSQELCDVIFLTNTADQDTYEMTLEAISSLKKSETKNKFKIILVESNQNHYYKYPVDIQLHYKGDFNFNKALNLAFENADSDFVAVFNNDVLFLENWYTILRYYMNIFNLDSASPRCPKEQFGIKPEALRFILSLPEAAVHVNGGSVTCFCGWGWVMKREVLNLLLPLPEEIKFWFQDDDISLSLKKLNKKHGLVTSSHVIHYGQKSYRHIERSKLHDMTLGVHDAFVKKWSN